jgi:hypothetical protein
VAEEDYPGTTIRYGTALEPAMVSLLRTAVRPASDE